MTLRLPLSLYTQVVGDDSQAPERRVVFLHGLFGRGKNLMRLAVGLEPEALSLLVDLPNHGGSDWTETFDYVEIADAVASHVRERFAGDGRVDVVGHSMGGKVAMVLALRHPDLVRRLVVIDISPVSTGSARGGFAHLLDALASVDLGALERRADAGAALRTAIPEDAVRGFLLQNLRRDDEGFSWEPNLRLLRDELQTVMGFPDMTGMSFDGPVLWIRGELSGYVRDEDAPTMRALFPRTVRITVRGSGHWVHSEQPEKVVAALRWFLFDGDTAPDLDTHSSG